MRESFHVDLLLSPRRPIGMLMARSAVRHSLSSTVPSVLIWTLLPPPCATSASTFLNNQSTHDVPNKASEGSAGFNEWWRFYPCIGNAVSPPVIRDIGSAILATLDLADRQISGTSRP